MDYKVLYRKYRPTNFDDVIGQDTSISLLKDSIINNKISHAYIFSGPRGTGKTSCAKIYAKSINCQNSENGNPCGKCENCLNFNYSNDIFEIDAASNNGVDQIREIVDNIKLSPINSKYKVYIIDEVHMLSTSAFNALLLTLEEPPKHAVFILATTNIENVPITVLSRCQRIDFRKIARTDIEFNLKKIANLENINITDDAIKEIAEFSDGGMRDALSILDQLSKFESEINLDVVLKSIGLISNSNVNNFIEALENNNVEQIQEFIDKARDTSADFKSLIKKIVICLKNKAVAIKRSGKSRLSYENVKNLCFELSNLLYKTNVNIDSFSLLELVILNYTQIESENNTNIKPPVVKEKIKAENINNKVIDDIVNIRVNNAFANASKKIKLENEPIWKNFITETKNEKIKNLVMDTSIVLASMETIVICSDFPEVVTRINNELQVLSEEYFKYTNKEYKITALSKKEWDKQVEKYKENIKNNIKYKIIEEPVMQNTDIKNDNNNEKLFNNVEYICEEE